MLASYRSELRWCLLGPALLPQLELPVFPPPAGLSALPDQAQVVPPQQPMRIGRRFEEHWRWAFAQLPGWTVLAHDLQIRDEGRTLGAPDLLVQGQGEVWHIELAVKFYLCLSGRSGEDRADWVGPSTNDRLSRKLSRMANHQLPLLQTEPARRQLHRLGLPLPTRTAVILRGVLFSHWQHPHPLARGRWCRVGDVPFREGTVLSRQEWLGATPAAAWGPLPDIARPTQVLDRAGTRWMIVPAEWASSVPL